MANGNVVQTVSDREVVHRVLNGDGASFELLMRRYNRRLYRIARGILRHEAEAEDAVQDAYVRAFEKLPEFRGDGPVAAWLAKITVNEALQRLRRNAADARGIPLAASGEEEEMAIPELTSSGPNPEQSAARGEIRRMLETAIDALPDAYRLVFVLRGLEELSVSEAAACLEVPEATIKSRYHRARRILQQHLTGLIQATAAEAFPFAGERCDRIVAAVFSRLGLEQRP